MRDAVSLADDGALVPCELLAETVHTHLRIADVELVSPSLAPHAVCSRSDVHPFVLPPPWNRFLVPRDAHFVGAGGCSREPAALVAKRVVELAAAHSSLGEAVMGGDVAECAAYSVPDAGVEDNRSEADDEEFDEEDEGLTEDDDDEWEDAVDEDVGIEADDIGLVAEPKE